jgi:hypothetical protein
MQGIRSRCAPLALALVLAATGPGEARALTLADLDAGASFSVGGLTFSGFEVQVTGDASSDLADYPVQLLADGFRVAGPLTLTLGEEATLLLSYVVEAATGIEGASLFSPLVAVGDGSAALVSESLLDGSGFPLATLLALKVVGGEADLADTASFASTSKLEVATVIALTSSLLAALPHVDQRFALVPEPLTLALLASGLVGLALFGGRRRAMVA